MGNDDKKKKTRTTQFSWSSKQELIDYFKDKYNIEEEMLEREIADTIRKFKPRKGQPLNVQELWQKIGTTLERHFSLSYQAPDEKEG